MIQLSGLGWNVFAGRQASRALRSTARPDSGAAVVSAVIFLVKADLAFTALFLGSGFGLWLMGPEHDNWILAVVSAGLLVVLWVLVRVGHRRTILRRWRRARPDLAAEWWAFDAHCREVGARPVFVWRVDRIQRGDMAYIAPVEVDGVTLTDSLFDGQRIAAGFWYATNSNVSWSSGFRSHRYLWVNSVSWPPVHDATREAAAQLWEEQRARTARVDELAAAPSAACVPGPDSELNSVEFTALATTLQSRS